MGNFLAVSGVIGAASQDVAGALREYVKANGGRFDTPSDGTPEDDGIGVIASSGSNTTVQYPSSFLEWDNASQFISERLGKAAFSLHIHDGDLWMYLLFDSGKVVDRFNTIPDYWGEVSSREIEEYRGNAETVASVVGCVTPESIDNYLIHWNPDEEFESKAYPDDEYEAGDCFQMLDFMKKVGLEYVMDDDGNLVGTAFRMEMEDAGFAESVFSPLRHCTARKPWWKFW